MNRKKYIVDPADLNAGSMPTKIGDMFSISIIRADDPDGNEVCSVQRPRLRDARKAAREVAAALSQSSVDLS